MEEYTLTIANGNYGIGEEITVSDTALMTGDTLTFVIRKGDNRLIEKAFTIDSLQDNTFSIHPIITQEDSELLPVGTYVWGIEHSRENMLSDLPIAENFYAKFIVKEGI